MDVSVFNDSCPVSMVSSDLFRFLSVQHKRLTKSVSDPVRHAIQSPKPDIYFVNRFIRFGLL
jgi:hypothetical protein